MYISELVGKIVNIASRTAKFINQHFANQLSNDIVNPDLLKQLQTAKTEIIIDYSNRNYAKVVRTVILLADKVNQFIDHEKPWQMIKVPGNESQTQAVCTLGLECFRLLILYLKPIVPELAKAVEAFLKIAPLTWAQVEATLFGQVITVFQPLISRVQQADIDTIEKSIGST